MWSSLSDSQLMAVKISCKIHLIERKSAVDQRTGACEDELPIHLPYLEHLGCLTLTKTGVYSHILDQEKRNQQVN